MKQSLNMILANSKYKLQTLEKSFKKDIPVKIIDERKLRLDYNIRTLSNSINMRLMVARSSLANLAGRLDALSPLAVLSRGYSITMDKQSNILKSINELQVDDNINISLHDGNVNCTVNSISERVNMD